jgi:hypothetical protein
MREVNQRLTALHVAPEGMTRVELLERATTYVGGRRVIERFALGQDNALIAKREWDGLR